MFSCKVPLYLVGHHAGPALRAVPVGDALSAVGASPAKVADAAVGLHMC